MTDNTQELDDLCPICSGSTWQMNADYEEVSCWHDIHDKDIKQVILDWNNKQIEEVLDRLESLNGSHPDSYIATFIEAERNKLKGE